MCLSNLSESDVKFMNYFYREFDVAVDAIRARFIFNSNPFFEGLSVPDHSLCEILHEETYNSFSYNLTPAQEFCHAFEDFFENKFWFTDYAKRGQIKLGEVIGSFEFKGREVILEKGKDPSGLVVYFSK